MATPVPTAVEVLVENVARDLPGLWSLLYAAELLTLRLADGPGRLDAGAVTAGMALRDAVEELEWTHPDVGTGAAALDLEPDLAARDRGRDAVERLLRAALGIAAGLVIDPGLPVDDVLMLARVVALIGHARQQLARPRP